MKKSKIIVSIILILTIIMAYFPNSLAVITDSDNGIMKYYNTRHRFDIKGYVNGEWQSTTYFDGGYHTVLKVDNNEEKELYLDENGDNVNGVEWDINCSFINNGRYVKITYTLTNTEATNKTISLGNYVDVQIAGDDDATIERFENSKGLKLYNEEENIQFSFYGKSVAGTTDIDNLWIGEYPQHEDEYFNNNQINKIENEDSAFTYSWVNRTLSANSTNIYSVIIGMGEVSNSPKIELDENQGNCFSQDSIIINGTVSDPDINSKATLYYTIDDGEENTSTESVLTNNKLEFELDLTSKNLSIGNHKIKLWAIDESGNPSEIIEKNIFITNLKAPTLNMSEDWTNEDVKFTVTDEVNDPDDVLKYQYKIENGEWTDIALNTEAVALDTTGTANVYARVIGKQTNEYSSTVSKNAKVDKDGPAITISENDGKVTITAIDEQSGLENIKYIFSTNEQLEESEELLDYSEPMEYNGTLKEDVYLHIIATDKLENEKTQVKKYEYPLEAEIEVEEKFVSVSPKYKLTDEKNQAQNNCIYQVQINGGDWQNVNANTEYTINNPITGKNTIKTRTIDALGRISEENVKYTNYIANDDTVAPDKLPNAGLKIIGTIVLIALIANMIIGRYRYNKLKNVK